jgi:thiamine transporter
MLADQLQFFFESAIGQGVTIAIIVVLFAFILISGRNKRTDTKGLVLSAIFVALYLAMIQITVFRFPQGGSLTAFSMLAITSAAYFLGTKRAVMAGMCAGLLELIFNPYVIHPIQLLLDYPLAVGALGLAGLAGNGKFGLKTGYLVGVFGRYLCVVLSGVIFFGAYAPEGFNAFTWAIYYNILYIGTEAIITMIILSLPPIKSTFQRLKRELQ